MNCDDQTRLVTLRDILAKIELAMGDDGMFYARFSRDGHQVTFHQAATSGKR